MIDQVRRRAIGAQLHRHEVRARECDCLYDTTLGIEHSHLIERRRGGCITDGENLTPVGRGNHRLGNERARVHGCVLMRLRVVLYQPAAVQSARAIECQVAYVK